MTNDTDSPTVLIVEDEPPVADLYAISLVSNCTVYTAYDGTEALDKLSPDVDVVLLDRRMPGRSAEAVLDTIREKGYNCRVAMVTAVTPDADLLELEVDDYLTKPVSEAELNETIDQLLKLDEYGERYQEYYQLVSKKEALEAERTIIDIETDEEFTRLTNRLSDLEAEFETNQKSETDREFCRLLDRRRSRFDAG